MRVDRDMPDPAASRPPLFVRMEGAYLPIPLASLRVDTVTDFDLYIQTNPAQSPVLYRERSLPFTEVERRRLETSRISALLVMAADAGAYRRYAEKNLGALLSDNTLPLGDRSAVLYVTAQLAVREMLRDPDKRRAVEQSMPLVENTILFMANNDAALGHLLRVSSYDYFTYTHSVNVCIYAIALARQYGRFDAPELRQLGQGALLHDVGKTLIDPQLLTMPGRLGKMQLETMKQHPILGFDLLREAGGVSEIGLDIVRHHHEKLQGNGYPDGVRGSGLSPFARIATIADIFDALTTNRTHKKALRSFDALVLMSREMADDLDMDVFRLFVKMLGGRESG